jgi:serine/threonine protein kinase
MKTGYEEHLPQVICENNHTFCRTCCSYYKSCPTCKKQKISQPEKDSETSKKIREGRKQLEKDFPFIPMNKIKDINQEPIAQGRNTDVFKGKWNSQLVALKRLRFKPKDAEKGDIQLEAAIGYILWHPNIVQMFGLVVSGNNLIGLVMEWADHGSLRDHWKNMSYEEKISASQGISQGLSHLHSHKLAHRDLKPGNVLLFGNKSTAKIADFGTSKVIQTIATNSGVDCAPKYLAPELLKKGLQVLLFMFMQKNNIFFVFRVVVVDAICLLG